MNDLKSNPNELVTIVMPCKNGSETILCAIDSVLNQDFENFELLIVDDGSSDESVNLIRSRSKNDHRVILIQNEFPGNGVWFARNVALKQAAGRYICFLDCDDYLLPKSLSSRLNALKRHKASVVYGPYLRSSSNGDMSYRKVPTLLTYKNMMVKNYIGNLTGMYDTKILGKYYQEDIRHEDYLMWCKIIQVAKVAYSTDESPLAVYKISANSLSGNKIKSFLWHWNVIHTGLGLKWYVASLYQLSFLILAVCDRFFEKKYTKG